MSFETALDALTSDARLWDEISQELGGAARSASGLVLDPSQFSFAGGGVAASYESARARVQALLDGGERETEGAATALLQVRQTYEGTDQAARAELEGVWDHQ